MKQKQQTEKGKYTKSMILQKQHKKIKVAWARLCFLLFSLSVQSPKMVSLKCFHSLFKDPSSLHNSSRQFALI